MHISKCMKYELNELLIIYPRTLLLQTGIAALLNTKIHTSKMSQPREDSAFDICDICVWSFPIFFGVEISVQISYFSIF